MLWIALACFFFLWGVGAAAVAAGVVVGAIAYLQLRQDHRALTQRVADLEPGARHDRLGRVHHDIGEAALFDLASLWEEYDAMGRKLEYFRQRFAHVAAGGKPDDPLAQWKKYRK